LAFTGYCNHYWAYAVLLLPGRRAQCFARDGGAGLSAFICYCYIYRARAAPTQRFARSHTRNPRNGGARRIYQAHTEKRRRRVSP
jgi:hypothetical protein